MFVLRAMLAARDATSCASFCGVVTTTTSARGRSWPSEIEMSPVPGGMSTTSMSISPQCTSVRNCSSARCSIGPRHITGSFVVEEEADRHQLQAVLHRRDDHLVDRDRLLVDAEDVRDRVPVDVGVEDADALAELRERDGEVRGEGRLADAALAARDRDHAAVARQADHVVALGCAAAQLRRQRLRAPPVS